MNDEEGCFVIVIGQWRKAMTCIIWTAMWYPPNALHPKSLSLLAIYSCINRTKHCRNNGRSRVGQCEDDREGTYAGDCVAEYGVSEESSSIGQERTYRIPQASHM